MNIKVWRFKTPLCNHHSPKPGHIPECVRVIIQMLLKCMYIVPAAGGSRKWGLKPPNSKKAGAESLQKRASICSKYSNIIVTALIQQSIVELYLITNQPLNFYSPLLPLSADVLYYHYY